MDQVSQGENSHTQFLVHVKKKRGRPRKDPTLMLAQAAHVPPGFQLKKEYLPQMADRTVGDDMVGQAVTGVVEATFDSGYLLTVRIGNSNINLRGVVFKPGHYSPITAKTDVAPYLQMIRRNDALSPAENQGLPSASAKTDVPPYLQMIRRNDALSPAENQGLPSAQKFSIQTAGGLPWKRKHTSPVTPAHPVGVRGTVVPVVLKPVNLCNGFSSSHQMPSDATQAPHMMASLNKDEHVSQPLGTFPPDRIIPAGQIFMAIEPRSSCQVKGSEHNDDNGCPNVATSEIVLKEISKTMKPSDVDTAGSSHSTAAQVENGSEIWKFSTEDSGVDTKQETESTCRPFFTNPLQSAFITQPLFNYGAGRMTELLKAVQENIRDNPHHQIAKNRTFTSQIEFLSPESTETCRKTGANVP